MKEKLIQAKCFSICKIWILKEENKVTGKTKEMTEEKYPELKARVLSRGVHEVPSRIMRTMNGPQLKKKLPGARSCVLNTWVFLMWLLETLFLKDNHYFNYGMESEPRNEWLILLSLRNSLAVYRIQPFDLCQSRWCFWCKILPWAHDTLMCIDCVLTITSTLLLSLSFSLPQPSPCLTPSYFHFHAKPWESGLAMFVFWGNHLRDRLEGKSHQNGHNLQPYVSHRG